MLQPPHTEFFKHLTVPDNLRPSSPGEGFGATWVGSDPLTGRARLVACYVPRYHDQRVEDLARLLGMTWVLDGVARYPFGLEAELAHRVIRVFGFGALCFQFQELDERCLQVAGANSDLLLLISNSPVDDPGRGILGLRLDQLWAALVRTDRSAI